ncbi:MAG: RdgB/HAM1 family non-canonical purine NTP pyrophosphatase [Acidobacteria bacterium]|nr:RdgB/HAM1 family non-canonical purine NTP pyrophosphatase [Acidobacteriota bacterium]
MTVLYCATGNPGKLREFREAAGDGFEILPCDSRDCPETGDTFEANALQKAHCYAQALTAKTGAEQWLFADDSGIAVDALGGAPGVYSARFAGVGADDAANNALLLDRLANVPAAERTARYVCVIALLRGNTVLGTFRAEAEGVILHHPRGTGGFGYDPYFHFPSLDQTFAEIPAELKWRHSHRGKAFRAMLDWFWNHEPSRL